MSSPYEDTSNLGGGATVPLSSDAYVGDSGASTAGSSAGSSSGNGGSTSTRPDVENESVGSIFSRLTSDVSTLMRQEVALAKLELKEEAMKTGKAAGMLGGAAFAGWMFAIFLSTWLMWLLGNAFDSYTWGALVVALLWGAAAAVLAVVGRKKLQEVNPKPEQTVETLKEDAQWLKAQKN